MQGDTTLDTGWEFVAEGEAVPTILDTLLRLDHDEELTRSQLATETGIPLKTLHLMDDVERLVELGLLEKRDPDGEETCFSVNADSEVLAKARAFGEAVSKHDSDR